MKKIIILFLFVISLSANEGCSHKENTKVQTLEKKSTQQVQVSNNSIKETILNEFYQWEGTPHKMGGNSKKGIDCSGFAHYMYRTLFNIKVPRSTKLFLKEGTRINKSQLKPGDMVIFSPPTYPHHVGIYVGDNKFIHASTTKGVMMSDLNNPYWLKYYLMSRRIIQKKL
jgi:cell wall-associated NlpC family hydrolase